MRRSRIGGSLAHFACSGWLVLAAMVGLCLPCFAQAQNFNPVSNSYLSPFPQGDRYHLTVFGDELAEGLGDALTETLSQEGSITVTVNSSSGLSIAKSDLDDLFLEADRLTGAHETQIVVILIGANDRATIRTADGERLPPGTPQWKNFYAKAAEQLIKKFKAANISLYWVGLPVMGGAGRNGLDSETASTINDAVREAAYNNGIKFIETWTGFTDQSGNYSAYGTDLTGQTRRLRESDGVSFTAAGNRKLADYVNSVIRRDLIQARSQRTLPLAGDEEEQARLIPVDRDQGLASSKQKGEAKPTLLPSLGSRTQNLPAGDTGPIPGQSPSTAGDPLGTAAAFTTSVPQGEMILGDTQGDLTSISIISPVGQISFHDTQRQTPLADRPYFRVFSNGEALPPKPGRADDFSWNGQSLVKSQ